MKIYKVKVNGKLFEVELEAIEEKKAPIVEAKEHVDSQTINAPMAGIILDIKVKVGDVIKIGDTIGVLETMKLENDIKANVAGQVMAIKVSKGQNVSKGEQLIVLG